MPADQESAASVRTMKSGKWKQAFGFNSTIEVLFNLRTNPQFHTTSVLQYTGFLAPNFFLLNSLLVVWRAMTSTFEDSLTLNTTNFSAKTQAVLNKNPTGWRNPRCVGGFGPEKGRKGQER